MTAHQLNGLTYWIFGNGNPVLFLHGFLESSTMWKYLALDQLPIQAILVDLPGHGLSQEAFLSENMEEIALQIKAVLAHENIVPKHIVGHSMGAYVGLELLQTLPEETDLILLNSNFWADSAEKKLDRNRVIKLVQTNKDFFIRQAIPALFVNPEKQQEAINDLIAEACRMTPAAISAATKALRDRNDFSYFTEKNPLKLKMIHGQKDGLIPKAIFKEKTKIAGLQKLIIKDSGHMSHIEKSTIVEDVLKAVLV